MVIRIVSAPKGWTIDPAYKYIGRQRTIEGVAFSGYFGNPVIRGQKCPICDGIHKDGGSTLQCYEVWLRNRIFIDPVYRESVKKLEGKILVCFCKPAPCHGDVLEKVCQELNKE